MESVDILLYRAMEGSLSRSLNVRVNAYSGSARSFLVYIESLVDYRVSDAVRKRLR